MVYGFDHEGNPPIRIWNKMEDFTGKLGGLDNPAAIFNGTTDPDESDIKAHGQESVAALGFDPKSLPAGTKICFGIMHGISEQDDVKDEWIQKFGNPGKIKRYLATTLDTWQDYTNSIRIHTANPDFDKWVKWILPFMAILITLGWLLLLPTVLMDLTGF